MNKQYTSTWFANIKNYKKVLLEDYNVRKLFEKEWVSLIKSLGVFSLEIKRTVNLFRLVIYTANSENLYKHTIKKNILTKIFEKKIKNLIDKKLNLAIIIQQEPKIEIKSFFIAHLIVGQIQKSIPLKKVIREVIARFKNNKVQGFKIQISGRLDGIEIARTEYSREGSLPLQTLRANICYFQTSALTKYGLLGIKVWVFNKNMV